MKKKIILLVLSLMLTASGVSASSLNGDYKGNPIVIVKSDGKILETDEVPAMIYDGHTVVPISLLRQLGASVTWDPNTYSVNVKIDNNNDDELKQLSRDTVVFRAIYQLNETVGLATSLIDQLPILEQKKDISKAVQSINRIDIESLRSWVIAFKYISLPETESALFDSAVTDLENVKNYMLEFDDLKAYPLIISAKQKVNQLYNVYDEKIKNEAKPF